MKTIFSIESCQDGYLLLTSSRDSNETKHQNGVVINSEILSKVMERNVMEWMWSSSTKRVGEQGWWPCSSEITRLPPTYVACVQLPASTPCGLSLLLVLFFALRGFSPGTSVFPSPQKPTLPTSNSIWNARTRFNEFLRSPKCSVVKQIKKFQKLLFSVFVSLVRSIEVSLGAKNCMERIQL